MVSIIQQIQQDALNADVPVTKLLREVKLAVAKLGLPEVEDWVDKELKGYGAGDEVPGYRKVQGLPVARAIPGGFQPLVFDTEIAEGFSQVPIGQSLPGLEG